MAGLDELKTSLTKHGYFKVAEVIKKFSRDQILNNISGSFNQIDLDQAQILHMLGGDKQTRELPEVWDEVRALTVNRDRVIECLVFISIIYSHKEFISTFMKASFNHSEMRGELVRKDIGEKPFSNMADAMDSLNFCVGGKKKGAPSLIYNLEPLFTDKQIGPLAKKVIYSKLIQTKWTPPDDNDHFKRNFYEQCFHYGFEKVVGLSQRQFEDWLEGREVELEEPPIVAYSSSKVSVSASLLAALRAKRFVIASGPSGTGKTLTIRQLAKNLSPAMDDTQFNNVFIPVESGWTDSRHLLGYKNPFGQHGECYSTTGLLSLLLRANHPSYKDIPFFIILDEMNLSYVEMYFAKFLSVMEASTHDGISEPILGIDDLELMLKSSVTSAVEANYIESAIRKKGLYLPKNVFIIGTVNVDETTHMFSPKVLDRAFVLEFETELPSKKADTFTLPLQDTAAASPEALSKYLLEDRTASANRSQDVFLDEIYKKLGRFKFGPRVTSEVQNYINATTSLKSASECHLQFFDESEMLDRIVMQKILPKIHGNRNQILDLLTALHQFLVNSKCNRSATKVAGMKADLLNTGFTNFFS